MGLGIEANCCESINPGVISFIIKEFHSCASGGAGGEEGGATGGSITGC